MSVHEARHREGRLPREGRRFLPGSESVLVPFLEFPDESDQVSADVPVASTVEHDAGAHKLTADPDDPFLSESAGRLLDPVASGFRAVDEVANRAEEGLEVLRLERKDGIRCDRHEGVAAPVEQVHGPDVLLFRAGASKGQGQQGGRRNQQTPNPEYPNLSFRSDEGPVGVNTVLSSALE